MLEARQLACTRGERTLFAGLDFSLPAGACLQVRGANGSGKTSLLRLLAGLALPAAGEVRWQGEGIRARREDFNRDLAYLGHAAAVKDELTASENLQFSAAMAGCPIPAASAGAALEAVGLSACRDLPARYLSQGQRRRVALARLAVTRARLWILDEPYTALDVAAAARLDGQIETHLRSGGLAVLTSHQPLGVRAGDLREIAL